MPDPAIQSAHTLASERRQLGFGHPRIIPQLHPQPGHRHRLQLAHIGPATQGAQPFLGFLHIHRSRVIHRGRRDRRRGNKTRHRQANFVGDAIGHRADHHLQTAAVTRPHHGHRTQCFQLGIHRLVAIDHVQAQARGASTDAEQVIGTAQGSDIRRCALVIIHYMRLRHLDIFPPRCLEVEAANAVAEHRVVDDRVGQAYRYHPPAIGRFAPAQHHVDKPTGEGKTEVDIQHIRHGHRQAGEQRMQQIEERREEHEGELNRLGHPGEERGQRH